MVTKMTLGEKETKFVGKMMPHLNERQRRLFISEFSDYLGYGSASELSELTGMSQRTISLAKNEFEDMEIDPLARPKMHEMGRIRAEDDGRKSVAEKTPEIKDEITKLLENNTVGNPESVITWTTLSTRAISKLLLENGMSVSHVTVGNILVELGYSLQQNKKYIECSTSDPDRDQQFKHISDMTEKAIESNQPVISVDAKKGPS